MVIDADSALKLLGKTATWKEKKVLGSVKYLLVDLSFVFAEFLTLL